MLFSTKVLVQFAAPYYQLSQQKPINVKNIPVLGCRPDPLSLISLEFPPAVIPGIRGHSLATGEPWTPVPWSRAALASVFNHLSAGCTCFDYNHQNPVALELLLPPGMSGLGFPWHPEPCACSHPTPGRRINPSSPRTELLLWGGFSSDAPARLFPRDSALTYPWGIHWLLGFLRWKFFTSHIRFCCFLPYFRCGHVLHVGLCWGWLCGVALSDGRGWGGPGTPLWGYHGHCWGWGTDRDKVQSR